VEVVAAITANTHPGSSLHYRKLLPDLPAQVALRPPLSIGSLSLSSRPFDAFTRVSFLCDTAPSPPTFLESLTITVEHSAPSARRRWSQLRTGQNRKTCLEVLAPLGLLSFLLYARARRAVPNPEERCPIATPRRLVLARFWARSQGCARSRCPTLLSRNVAP